MSSINGRVKHTAEEIEQAINGEMKLTSRLLLGKMLAKLETCEKELEEIYNSMQKISTGSQEQIKLIDSIPGLGEVSAIYIIAEIGTDMTSFKTANHLTAWAGLAPKDRESAGNLKSSKTKKANIYIKSVLTECAWAATKTRNTRLSNWYWSNVKRLGEKKAITAVARKLLVYIYAMLKSGELYDDSLDAADSERRKAEKLESAHKIVEHRSCRPNADGQTRNGTMSDTATVTPEPSASANAQNGLTESKAPKKRGRPRKAEADESNSVGEPKALKKSGRPCKVKTDEALTERR